MEVLWNLWHGCHKWSDGCKNCYVYRGDEKYNRNSSVVEKTKQFDLPVKRTRQNFYKIPAGSMIWTCFTSDFLLEDADEWRKEAWKFIKERSDCHFFFITKRIERFSLCKPADWGEGYENVTVACTVENQAAAERRLPILLSAPLKHRVICCEPLLEQVDLSPWLNEKIEQLVAGGESGERARECHYDWILSLRAQCEAKNVTFRFKQTGAKFVKDGKLYKIPRNKQHAQAKKANIDFLGAFQLSQPIKYGAEEVDFSNEMRIMEIDNR